MCIRDRHIEDGNEEDSDVEIHQDATLLYSKSHHSKIKGCSKDDVLLMHKAKALKIKGLLRSQGVVNESVVFLMRKENNSTATTESSSVAFASECSSEWESYTELMNDTNGSFEKAETDLNDDIAEKAKQFALSILKEEVLKAIQEAVRNSIIADSLISLSERGEREKSKFNISKQNSRQNIKFETSKKQLQDRGTQTDIEEPLNYNPSETPESPEQRILRDKILKLISDTGKRQALELIFKEIFPQLKNSANHNLLNELAGKTLANKKVVRLLPPDKKLLVKSMRKCGYPDSVSIKTFMKTNWNANIAMQLLEREGKVRTLEKKEPSSVRIDVDESLSLIHICRCRRAI
eukprot:TRINITY_DN11276_c0_g2_i4.p1 TRINITY_DN11276_c0_g2~~TRINITY_DN11276_c0_g2_i4.p1  ORF type:complete len:350 (-),score=42.49 TRINITY_DN11276_c0_g2_i4:23-1072(-)